jgi:hypothetical protein
MKNFKESRWYKVMNGGVGLTATFFALLFFVLVITYYIVRIRQSGKSLFKELFTSLTGDGQKSAKILRASIFLLLALGFIAVLSYNINKMATDDPKISLKVDVNKKSPSIIFCSVIFIYGTYRDGFDDTTSLKLTNSFNNITLGTGQKKKNCTVFNETLSDKPAENIGGIYLFEFFLSDEIGFLEAFIGDFDNIDRRKLIPQGKARNNVGTYVLNRNNSFTYLTYEEIRYKDLDGGGIHRSYQFYPMADFAPAVADLLEPGFMLLGIVAPNDVVINEEEPPHDLAAFFGNVGGYLTIWGVFGFLFGSGKMSPFGFVTQYVFQYKNLGKDLESVKELEEVNITNSDKDKEVEAAEKVNESKFEKVLKKYYIDIHDINL